METELPPQESEGKTARISQYLTSAQMLMNLGTCLRHIQPHQTLCPPSDLFQDLSQLQETWLTEGENSASGPLYFSSAWCFCG